MHLVGAFPSIDEMHRWTRKHGREKSATTKWLKCKIFWNLTAFFSGLLRVNVNDLHTVHTHELISWVRKVASTLAQLQFKSSSNKALTKRISALPTYVKTELLCFQSSWFSSHLVFTSVLDPVLVIQVRKDLCRYEMQCKYQASQLLVFLASIFILIWLLS